MIYPAGKLVWAYLLKFDNVVQSEEGHWNWSNFDFLHIPKGTTRANVLRYGQSRVARLIQIPILIGRQITFKHISGLIRTWHRMNCPIVGRASNQEGTKGGSVKRYKKYTVHFS
ncbi:hypothetical protein BA746_20815 [Vibrio parahaemolyticus]|nr:hypothetical protein BA746_20815 [Vibrio parahaemolyticus]